MHRFILATFLFGCFLARCHAADLAAGAARDITLDGRLEEAAWREARPATNFRPLAARGGTVTAQTRFMILVDDEAFYVGIHCAEPNMTDLKANPMPRDGNVFSEDCVEIFFDPTGKGTEYYQIAISANNDVWDQYFIESGNTTIGPYSSLWESAVHTGEDFWSLEVCIPFAAMYLTPAAAFETTWLLNVTRERKPVPELSTWSALQVSFHEPARFNSVDGMRVKNPRYDLAIEDVQAAVESTDGETYGGRLAMRISATAVTAGDYRLTLSSEGQPLAPPAAVTLAAGENAVTVPNVRFRHLGQQNLRLALSTPDGEEMGGRFFPLRVTYTPLDFDVTEPFYANCIFPDETVRTIEGALTVNLPAGQLAGAVVEFALTGPGIETPVAQRVPLTGRRAAFALDAAALTIGEAQVRARVLAGGRELAAGATTVRKLAPTPGSMLRIDRGLRLVVNGEPTFVRGWYGPSWMIGWAYEKQFPSPRAANPAVNMGRQIGMEAERISRTARAQAIHDVEPEPAIFAEMLRRIEAERDSEDLWWYYLADEPECRHISPVYLKHQYDFIKKHDPYRPVMIITRSPELYVNCADILNPHPYLNPSVAADGTRSMRSPVAIRNQVQTVLDAGNRRKLPLLTPQSFSYGFINRFATYPTFDEYRCMMWVAVVNECRGFTPFTYGDSRKTWQLRYGSDFIYDSMAALDDFLIQPGPPRPLRVEAPENGVDAMIRRLDNGELLLAAVNLLDRPIQATITADDLVGRSALYAFREEGTTPIRGSRVTLDFPAYGVRLLTGSRRGQDLESVAALRRRIADAEATQKRPGNILYGRGREIEFTSSSTYIRPMSLQTSLTDGMRDVIGWRHIQGPAPAWVEMAFPTFVPEFKAARIYGNRLENMTFEIWYNGEWKLVGTAPDDPGHEVTFDFPERLRTVKIRLSLPNSRRGHVDSGELYEVELYE